jgi:zinc/manganese transport system substrate-binding protein
VKLGATTARRLRACAAATLAILALAVAAGCGSGDGRGDRPAVAVTTPVLGSLVRDLVGDRADVVVIIPDGADPHEYQPSARDAEALASADLVVENGLDLEEGLEDVLARAREDGVPVVTATDHVTLREAGPDEAGGGEEHGHGPEDPHVWMDPLAMADLVAALAPVVSGELGLDVTARAADLDARLQTLNA